VYLAPAIAFSVGRRGNPRAFAARYEKLHPSAGARKIEARIFPAQAQSNQTLKKKSNTMKKKILIGIAAAAVAAIAAVNVNVSSKKNLLSDISLANIEALGVGESNSGFQQIVISQVGQPQSDCVNGRWVTKTTTKRECRGKGNLPCTSGTYVLTETGGNCVVV
jgi:hypothetical protein